MAARKRRVLSHEETEQFLFEEDSENELSDLSSSDSEGFVDSETEEEVIEEESSDELYEEQVVEDEELPAESQQQKTTPENENTNKEIAPVIIIDHDNLSWEDIPPQMGMKRVPFNGKPGVNASIISSEPIQIFEHFFTDELIEHIVYYTNLFAEQSIAEKQREGKLKKRSRENSWQPITPNDIQLYIAVLIYRGLIWKPTIHMYYTKNILFSTPEVPAIMPQQKFILIEKYLHFDYLVDKFRCNYIPERDVSIDVSLLLWKGRLSWKQYISRKRSCFGLKSFVLAEAESGYIWNSILHSGNDTDFVDGRDFQYNATKIVFSLAKDLLNQGYCIYVDNWYTSLELCANLRYVNTDVIGTLHKDRKGLPKDVVEQKRKRRNVRSSMRKTLV